ncbi:MAG TPA: hypothetical protein VFY60_12955 [Pyrinomonadaceae bacterium]|nr:hypothetical protein [Pyrinomonadaceae bacterium]
MKVGFNRIFWGLLFVVLDIRINSIDLFLPDFVGYILIASGLGLLAPHDKWFRSARVIAIIMIAFSLTDLVEVKVDSKQAPRLKREWISLLTGDLSTLLPQQVDSAHLLRTTTSANEINANRTHNPERDEDRVLAEYSDGTVILILRYASSDEALAAMKQKDETEYSFDGIRKRAETDASFKAEKMSAQHGSSGSQVMSSAHSKVEAADRVIQQWWSRGGNWWNPSSWRDEGGWSGNLLYIVEGYRASADAYKSTFERKSHNGDRSTFDPLFPISTVRSLLDTLLIWGLCSGVIALSVSSNNYALMRRARRRRNLYFILGILGLAVVIMSFIAPEAVLSSGAIVLVIPYAFAVLFSVLLIMLLMRRAANTL